ncbi:EamA family transporter [Aquicoccus sp. SCR17]|nr:EamA family transporter [Carideicomes alvinocaridis]
MQAGARGLGVAAVLGAAMLWGSTGTLQALLPAARDPLVVGALRLLVGALTLLAIAALHGPSRRALAGLRAPWLLAAGGAMAAYNLLFFRAVLDVGVGIGTALTIGSAPVWVLLWELARHRRLPRGLRLLGQAICIAGATILAMAGQALDASAPGIAAALLSGAAYAGYSLLTSRFGGDAPPAAIAAATFGTAALLTLPVLALRPLGWALAPGAWPWLLMLGMVSTGLSYALYTYGLRLVAAGTAVTLALAEPLTAWILATVIVGEPVTAPKLAGALLLIAGLLLVTAIPARRRA